MSTDKEGVYVGPGDEVRMYWSEDRAFVVRKAEEPDEMLVAKLSDCYLFGAISLTTPDGEPVLGIEEGLHLKDILTAEKRLELEARIAELEHELEGALGEARVARAERDNAVSLAATAQRERNGARAARDHYISAHASVLEAIESGIVGIVKPGKELGDRSKMHYWECFPKGWGPSDER